MRSHVVTHRRAFRVFWQEETTKADRKAMQMKLKGKERYDRTSHKLPDLPFGAIVQIQHTVQMRWQDIGEIIEERHGGHIFLVRSESGRVYWSNRQFLKLYSIHLHHDNRCNISTLLVLCSLLQNLSVCVLR